MSSYTVRGPDGKSFKVNTPAGATSQDAVSYVKQKYYGEPGIQQSPFEIPIPKEQQEQAGLKSSFMQSATILGLADEATAWAADDSEENRRKLLEAAESKYESAGGFGMDKGLAKNFQAFRELLGGSLGFLAAPAVAATVGSIASPFAGVTAGATTLTSQYGIQNLLRQAEEQEKAISEGEAPEELALGKAAVAAVGSTALDYVGMRLFSPLFSKFPVLRNLLGEADDKAAKETGQALEEVLKSGKYSVKNGVLTGSAKGIVFEIPQEIAQQALERWQAGLPVVGGDASEEYKQAAIGGALLGSFMGGASGAIRNIDRRSRAEAALAEEAEATRLRNLADEEITQAGGQLPIPGFEREFGGTRTQELATKREDKTRQEWLDTLDEKTRAEELAREPSKIPSFDEYLKSLPKERQAQVLERIKQDREKTAKEKAELKKAGVKPAPAPVQPSMFTKEGEVQPSLLRAAPFRPEERGATVTDSLLEEIGITKRSPIRKNQVLEGMDIRDPAQAEFVYTVLNDYASNYKGENTQVLDRIERYLGQKKFTGKPTAVGDTIDIFGRQKPAQEVTEDVVSQLEDSTPVDTRTKDMFPLGTMPESESVDMFPAELREASVVDTALLDTWGVSKSAPLYQFIKNSPTDKTITDPEVQKRLKGYASKTKKESTAAAIKEALARVPSLEAAAPAAKPMEITDKVMDAFDVSKNSLTRKRLVGKDIRDPEVYEKLMRAPDISREAKLELNKFVQGIPREQMTIADAGAFGTTRARQPAPKKGEAEFTTPPTKAEPVAEPAVVEPVKAEPVKKSVKPKTTKAEPVAEPAVVEPVVEPTEAVVEEKADTTPETPDSVEDVGRPTNRIPLRPQPGEKAKADKDIPDNHLSAIAREIREQEDISRTLASAGSKTKNLAYGKIEAVDVDARDIGGGISVYRVLYSDKSVSALAINNNGDVLVKEFTPGLIPQTKPLVAKEVDNTAVLLSDSVIDALSAGKLQDALTALAKESDVPNTVRTVARILSRVVGGTKVSVVNNLTDSMGMPVAGLFDPKTNSIKLDSVTGLNSHVLLHEQTHAAVSAVLDNASNPVTKKLNNLFNEVKPFLDTAYGATNLQEFVAEAFTNPSFQQKLSSAMGRGQKLSVFERFVNAVSNFVRSLIGMPHKNEGIKDMDNLANTIMSIMAPAPEYRNTGELFMVDARTAAKDIDEVVSSVPSMNTTEAKSNLRVLADSSYGAARSVFSSLASLPVMTEFAKRYIPFANDLINTVRLQEGYRRQLRGKGDALVLDIQKWVGKDAGKLKAFSDLINYSTRDEVDASLTGKEAEAAYSADKEREDAWLKWSIEYNKLDATGKELYNKVFGKDGKTGYGYLRNQFMDSFRKQLKATDATDAQVDQAVSALETKLLELGYVDPYARLGRNNGKYRISYTGIDPVTGREELYVENYTNTFQREKRIKELNSDPEQKQRLRGNIARFENLSELSYKGLPPGSFMESVLNILRDNKIDPQVEEEILRTFVNLLPETAYLKGMTKRKGTLGFQNAIASISDAYRDASFQLSSSMYRPEFNQFNRELYEFAEKAQREGDKNSDKIKEYRGYLQKHLDFALDPNVENWAKIATSIGFNYNLGGNMSGYVVNMSALPMINAPYIAGKHINNYNGNKTKAYTDTATAFGRAFTMFKNSKSFIKDINNLGLEGYDFSSNAVPEKLKLFAPLQAEMRDRGQFRQTTVERELDLEGAAYDWFTKLNQMSGWFMSHSEQVLRETTTMAEYQMSLASQLGTTINQLDKAYAAGRITPEMAKKAALDAIDVADLVNSGVMAQMAPPIGKRGLGKPALLFRKYTLNLFGVLMDLANTSIRGSAADKKVARTQLAGVFGGSVIVAGIGGTPFLGTLALLYNLYKDDDDDDLETEIRKVVGERLYGGIGNYVLGASLSSRIGLSDFLFRESFASKDQPYVVQAMELLAGSLFGSALQLERGYKLIGDGEISRGVEAMLPVAARNPMKAIRFYSEGVQSLDGDQIMPPVNEKEALFQTLGFAPAEYMQKLEKNSATYRKNRLATQQRSDIYRKYFRAYMDNDLPRMNGVVSQINEYNRKYPEFPISYKDIKRSVANRIKSQQESLDGVTVNKRLRGRFMDEREEWDSVQSLWGDIFD